MKGSAKSVRHQKALVSLMREHAIYSGVHKTTRSEIKMKTNKTIAYGLFAVILALSLAW